jgi:hypothetical protein
MSATSTFIRPERSSARTSEGGAGITGAASNAANQLYQNAPDLGVGAAISNFMGQGQGETQKGADAFDEQEDDRINRINRSKGNGISADSDLKQSGQGGEEETARQLSERTGPSDKSRVGKSQFQIGTETHIPTTSGDGTTASPDQTNLKALEKANSQGKTQKAHVPHDYEPLSAPSGGGVGSSGAGAAESQNDSRRPSAIANGRNTPTASSPSSPRKSSGHYVPPMASDGSPLEMEKRRSIGEKIKDQVKGEMKILAGTVTGSDEKILKGLAIKHGEHSR